MSKKIRSRKWLNPPKHGGTAFLAYEIDPYTNKTGCWADFKIADCNRTVTLEFGFDNKDDFDDRIAKLDLLLGELTTFKGKLVSIRDAMK